MEGKILILYFNITFNVNDLIIKPLLWNILIFNIPVSKKVGFP